MSGLGSTALRRLRKSPSASGECQTWSITKWRSQC
jgi:hypothetical protein